MVDDPRPKPRVAYAWLDREDWPRWLAADALFEPSYEAWIAKNEARLYELKKLGTNVHKVTVRFDEFAAWAKVKGCAVDTKARAQFAAVVLGRRKESH